MTEFFSTPTEQHLALDDMATITRMGVPDPPEMSLVLDVIHEETQLKWRQEIRLGKIQMVELTQLMDYSCSQVGIDWRPSDAADFTPPD